MAVRQLLKQETILTIIMITVTTILIIGATVAWFLGNRPVTIQNYFQQAGGIDGIDVKMAIVPGATGAEGSSESGNSEENGSQDPNLEEVGDVTYYTMNAINDNRKVIDVDLADLTNIEEGKLGPGSYGTIKFKISTTSEEEMKYIIRITPSIEVVNGVVDKSDSENQISKELLLDLVQNHIKFYAIKNTEESENAPTNVYQNVIPYYFENETNTTDITTTGLTDTVSSDKAKYVTIYWYWPYEYNDIPGYGINDYNSTIYDPWSVVDGNKNIITYENKYSSSLSEAERIEAYDWDDTKIGNYVKALNFHFEVSTYQ